MSHCVTQTIICDPTGFDEKRPMLSTNQYSVFVDLCRKLSAEERTTVAHALDSAVSGGGCVGTQAGPFDEIYFTVDALSPEDAHTQAVTIMNSILQKIELRGNFTTTVWLSN